MLTERWVPPEDLNRVVKSVLAQKLGVPVRLVACPIMDLPEEHPIKTSPYVEVHPDGLVEMWAWDGTAHVLDRAIQSEPSPDLDVTFCGDLFAPEPPQPCAPVPQPQQPRGRASTPAVERRTAPFPTFVWNAAVPQSA